MQNQQDVTREQHRENERNKAMDQLEQTHIRQTLDVKLQLAEFELENSKYKAAALERIEAIKNIEIQLKQLELETVNQKIELLRLERLEKPDSSVAVEPWDQTDHHINESTH